MASVSASLLAPAPEAAFSGQKLSAGQRIVVKIGSALLVDGATGAIRRDWLETVAADVAALRSRGIEVLLVSSGAVAVGRFRLGLPAGPLKLEEKQAAAATGQIRLAHAYEETLARHGLAVAQILLTPSDTEQRRRHLNARATLQQLLGLGAVPVINENDTVATSEIRFGDNDRLAARVAQMVSADTLVLLSDIDGLYTADPRRNPAARHLPEVPRLTPEIEAMAGPPVTAISSGGMVTKLVAARIAVNAGCRMVIAKGHQPHPLAAIDEPGARTTWFLAEADTTTQRKRWIAAHLNPPGTLLIDRGAALALARGSSLLPAGVVAAEGRFERGDAVSIARDDGSSRQQLARGLASYGRDEVDRICGRRSEEIEALLGYRRRDEIVHRDDLVLLSA